MLNSIWAEDIRRDPFPVQEQDLNTDILIVGGGMAGLLCQRLLTDAGADCILIEADRILGGVTRNTTAKITSQHGFCYDKLTRQFDEKTARLYYDANEAALAKYRSYAQSIDCDFETKDSYVYEVGSSEKLDQELSALKRLRIPAEPVGASSLPVIAAGAIRFRDQAQFHPLKFGFGIAQGLRIYENTRALEFAPHTVTTNHGKITANRIIIATHVPFLNKHGGYFLKMYQQRSYVLALKNAPMVDGMYRDEAKDGLSLRSYGDLLLLGGGSHRTGKKSRGWEDLETYARIHYPQAKIRCRWATQDCITLDGMPYIGQYGKGTPDVFVATGFNKWGMTSSMVSAMILTDLLQGRENPYAQVFSPSRTILRPQLLCNAAESAVNLLTPTAPRCPHLGCALKWNRQEHSWDCPCHGSRFAEDGKLLDNPATGDLQK